MTATALLARRETAGATTEDWVRSITHSLPPSDFGSTRAIRAMAAAIDARDARAIAATPALIAALEGMLVSTAFEMASARDERFAAARAALALTRVSL